MTPEGVVGLGRGLYNPPRPSGMDAPQARLQSKQSDWLVSWAFRGGRGGVADQSWGDLGR